MKLGKVMNNHSKSVFCLCALTDVLTVGCV